MSTSAVDHSPLFLVICVLAILSISASICSAQSGVQGDNDTLSLCFLSDTQDPIFLERIYQTYDRNALARKLIFEKVCETNAKSVFHLGDLVSIGSGTDSWEDIDQFVKKLHEQGIEFSPIPGNHEYMLFSDRGITNFAYRYPNTKLTGYSRQFANVAVVLFNSNFKRLSEDEEKEQLSWYRRTLTDYENNPSIDFVIIGCHHSPFTNSTIVSGSEEVREFYLPEYYKSKKCKLFLGGHAHAYEHFRNNEKDFLVIGGGGGLLHPLRVGEGAEYHDIFGSSLEKRMFHFLLVKTYHDTLKVELKMLRPDFEGFESIPQLIFVGDR